VWYGRSDGAQCGTGRGARLYWRRSAAHIGGGARLPLAAEHGSRLWGVAPIGGGARPLSEAERGLYRRRARLLSAAGEDLICGLSAACILGERGCDLRRSTVPIRGGARVVVAVGGERGFYRRWSAGFIGGRARTSSAVGARLVFSASAAPIGDGARHSFVASAGCIGGGARVGGE
jgi:hypothetical protein